MMVAIGIFQVKTDHRIIKIMIVLDSENFIVHEMFFNLGNELFQFLGKCYFKFTRVLYICFHIHLIKAEAHVKPLPNAARQTISPVFILPSSHASSSAIGMEAAVVFPYLMMLL